jgi:hypothetical protein
MTPVLVVAALLAVANAAPTHSITIRHQPVGCHAWSLDDGAFRVSLSVTLRRGEAIEFVNDDAMSHRLVELSGPTLALPPTLVQSTFRHRGGGSAAVTFTRSGTYRLRSIDDETDSKPLPTTGADNMLRLTVLVR